MAIKDIVQLFHSELKALYPPDEIEAFVFHSLNELLLLSKAEIIANREKTLSVTDHKKLQRIIAQLKTNKPLQYILGSTIFYGCKLNVNEHVLIPRPETEELVDWIISESSRKQIYQEFKILDIGCGSGCIAIALKKNIPGSIVTALDISSEALTVAKANAILNHTEVNWLQADILKCDNLMEQPGAFNIIVSNPPYIRISEKDNMHKNVLDHEPHLALFVHNDDPLLFYHAIADFALKNLRPDGKLYVEINEAFGTDVKSMLVKKGFYNITLKRDMSGKERMVMAEINSTQKVKHF